MKRRDFLIRAAGVVGSVPVARSALGQQPCPPILNVEGGSSAPSWPCGIVGALPIHIPVLEAETPEQIALHASVAGSISDDTSAVVRYREEGTNSWLTGHPLYRIDPGGDRDAFAGTIFDLTPGKSYEVEINFFDGISTDIRADSFRTRDLPSTSGAATATPGDVSAVNSALASAAPGDVIELQPGTYDFNGPMIITVSGTQENPIYIRGSETDSVIIRPTGGGTIIDLDANYIVLENLTLTGNGTTGSGHRAIRLGRSGDAHYNVIRNIKANSARGFMTAGGTSGEITNGNLVYNCELKGLAPWTNSSLTSSTYWSEDGIRLVGTGNCVWNNTLEGFGDSITFAHSTSDDIRACYAYRNFIRNSVDDAIELDHHVRNFGFYDNYFENIKTAWSQSDESSLGPSYIFRNLFVNVALRCIKPNSSWEGFHVYNNTWLRADSPDGAFTGSNTRGRGLFDGSPSGDQDRFAWRNNLLIYRGTKTPDSGHREVFHFRWGTVSTCDMSNNGHYPDIRIDWEADIGPFDNLAEARFSSSTTAPLYPEITGLGAPTKRYSDADLICESNPFQVDIVMGSDAETEITGRTPLRLKLSSSAKGAGVSIPNITDGHSGVTPDIGALIEGRDTPNWGASI